VDEQIIAYRFQQGLDPALTPIVLLHGLSQQGDFWHPLIEALGPDYTVLTVDLRGHGDSRDLVHDYQISTLAQDVVELISLLRLAPACVVGHSWGAAVALHFSAQHEQFVRSCVLLDGGAFTPANILALGWVTVDELRSELTPPPGPFSQAQLEEHYLAWVEPEERESIMNAIARTYTPIGQDPGSAFVTTIGVERHMQVLDAFLHYNPDDDLRAISVATWILIAVDLPKSQHMTKIDDWDAAKAGVTAKVRGKSNIALQHWYGALHDVPLYWPQRVASLISHAASKEGSNSN